MGDIEEEGKEKVELNECNIVIDLKNKILIGKIEGIIDKEKILQEESTDMSDLNEDEELIFDLIRKSEGIYQSDLPEITGFSKYKICRIVKSLRSKEVIQRKKEGLTFLLEPRD